MPQAAFIWLGLLGSSLSIALLVAYTICLFHPLWKMETPWPPTTEDLVLFYGVFTTFALVCLLLLRLRWLCGLRLEDTQIEIGRRRLNLADIERVHWRTQTNSVEISANGKTIPCHFGLFTRPDQLEIIEALRQILADRPQSGWEQFIQAKERIPPPPNLRLVLSGKWEPWQPRRVAMLLLAVLAAYGLLAFPFRAVMVSQLPFIQKNILGGVLFGLPIFLAALLCGFFTLARAKQPRSAHPAPLRQYKRIWGFDSKISLMTSWLIFIFVWSSLVADTDRTTKILLCSLAFLLHIFAVVRLSSLRQCQPLSFPEAFFALSRRQFLELSSIMVAAYFAVVSYCLLIFAGSPNSLPNRNDVALFTVSLPFGLPLCLFFICFGFKILAEHRLHRPLIAGSPTFAASALHCQRRNIVFQICSAYGAIFLVVASGAAGSLAAWLFLLVLVFYSMVFERTENAFRRRQARPLADTPNLPAHGEIASSLRVSPGLSTRKSPTVKRVID